MASKQNFVIPCDSVKDEGRDEELAVGKGHVQGLVGEDLVQGPRVAGHHVQEEDPEPEADVVAALEGGHLGADHPRVPHRVPE